MNQTIITSIGAGLMRTIEVSIDPPSIVRFNDEPLATEIVVPPDVRESRITSFATAQAAVVTEGRVAREVAEHRLTICTGLAPDGVRVSPACRAYMADDAAPRGAGTCGSCGCPKWPLAVMRRKVYYPTIACPRGAWGPMRGRRAKEA